MLKDINYVLLWLDIQYLHLPNKTYQVKTFTQIIY